VHPHRRKGVAAEREVGKLLSDLLGVKVVRRYNLGTHEDTGDLLGVPETTVQVCDYSDLARAVREKLPELAEQQARARTPFGALFCRRRGGRYVVVMSPESFAGLLRAAVDWERRAA
jgi:hypothetical protein